MYCDVGLPGCWVSGPCVRFSAELRPVLYSAMLSLLQPNEDLVVRLTVSHALKLAMDDFEFSTDQFLEYLEPVIGLLFNLLKNAKNATARYFVIFCGLPIGTMFIPHSHTYFCFV